KTIIESLKDRQILYNDPSVGITALPQDKGTTYFSRFAIPMSKSSQFTERCSLRFVDAVSPLKA
ncbi:MAG: hypothetical protein RR068_18495, partial [Hafnia sp.]